MGLASLPDRIPSPAALLSRAQARLTGSTLFTSLLILLLVLAVSRSAASPAWMNGMGILPLVAIAGATITLILALSPLRTSNALLFNLALGTLVTVIAIGGALHAVHPSDPSGLAFFSTWKQRLAQGEAIGDPAFDLYLACWLLYMIGGWLSWCVLRLRQAFLGIFPAITLFAVTLLNFPVGQNGYVLAVLFLTLLLLLWSNYTATTADARTHNVKMGGDVGWDFWESALVVMAALIVLSIMLPPLSATDQTSAFFHFGQGSLLGNGPGFGQGSTGFSTDVPLGGALTRTQDVVFTYTVTGDYTAPRYFRGVNVTKLAGGEWSYPLLTTGKLSIPKNAVPPYDENYLKLALASFNIDMLSPPTGNPDILFYPGQLYRVDRATLATQTQVDLSLAANLLTIDRLSSTSPVSSAGNYVATVEYSTATQADLEAAGTSYPNWLFAYNSLPSGYRSPEVLSRIHALALQVTKGTTNPYDQAVAIETYLRNNYTYTLTPPATPEGMDPLDYFLFTSKKGYCQFFATAMGDMLRSLGLPARLVNGFGPGQFDSSTNRYVVRSADAHTWVESYFPTYGWITFEPTSDGAYFPVSRGASGPNLCLRDNNCDNPTAAGSNGSGTSTPRPSSRAGGPNQDPGGIPLGGGSIRVHLPDSATIFKILAASAALTLILLAALLRYLRPRRTMQAWQRMLALSAFAGARPPPGATPLEVGRLLARHFPEASGPIGRLSDSFTLAAYAPPPLASDASIEIRQAFSELRWPLLRRILARLRGASIPSQPV